MLAKISPKQDYQILFFLCWFAYFSAYIGRLNYSAALPAILNENYFAMGPLGIIATVFFLTYGLGQLINGILGDYFPPEKMIFSGLLISAFSNLLMIWQQSLIVMIIFWGINGFAQSMIWSPMMRFFCLYIADKSYRDKSIINMSTAVAMGTLGAYSLSGLVLSFFPWQGIFIASGLWLLAAAVLWKIISSYLTNRLPKMLPSQNPQEETVMLGRKFFCTLPFALIVFTVMIQGIIKDGLTNWTPVYFQEIFCLDAAKAVFITMLLPVFNLIGVYFSAWLNKKSRNELKTAVWLFSLAVLCLALLYLVNKPCPYLAAVLLAAVSALTLGINTMLISLYPLNYAKEGKVSTITGLLNACGYLAAALGCLFIGYGAEKWGWNDIILLLLGGNVLAVLALSIVRRDNIYKRQKSPLST